MDGVEPAVAEPLLQSLTGVGTPARAVGSHDARSVGLPHRPGPGPDQEMLAGLALRETTFKVCDGSLLVHRSSEPWVRIWRKLASALSDVGSLLTCRSTRVHPTAT